MRKYTNDVKANGKDPSELDPCLAARSRQKQTFLAKWKKWMIVGVIIFTLLIAALIGFRLFMSSPAKQGDETMEYVHEEVRNPPPDYDAEDLEALAAGSRSMHYNHPKPYKNDHDLAFQSFSEKDPDRVYSPIPRTQERPLPDVESAVLAATTISTSTLASSETNVVTNSTVVTEPANVPLNLAPSLPFSTFSSTTTVMMMTTTTAAATTTSKSSTAAPSTIVPVTSQSQQSASNYETHVAIEKPLSSVINEVKKNCFAHNGNGSGSGIYLISPDDREAFPAFCDQNTSGGGWTVIQRRVDRAVYFYNRTYQEYEEGFGDFQGSHWLGLSKIYSLAPQHGDNWILRIELRGDNCTGANCLNKKDGYWWAEWPFKLGDSSTGYVLSLGSAVAGNLTIPGSPSLLEKFNNGRPFTTIDRDVDGVDGLNCAQFRNFGGWWHGDCGFVALNGLYGDHMPTLRYMVYTYTDTRHRKYYIHPMKSLMMIRPSLRANQKSFD